MGIQLGKLMSERQQLRTELMRDINKYDEPVEFVVNDEDRKIIAKQAAEAFIKLLKKQFDITT